jgi:hypothetical protein
VEELLDNPPDGASCLIFDNAGGASSGNPIGIRASFLSSTTSIQLPGAAPLSPTAAATITTPYGLLWLVYSSALDVWIAISVLP